MYFNIANVLAEYCLALDHDEIERCVALFTEDASFDVYDVSFTGRASIRKMMEGAPKGLHLGGPPLLERVGPEQAEVKQNLLFVDRESGDMRSALYSDVFVPVDDAWRIRRRRCQFITATGVRTRPDR